MTTDRLLRGPRAVVAVMIMVVCAVLAGCAVPGDRPGPSPTASAQRSGGAGAQRPNIVLVLTDDLTADLLRFMPHVQAMRRQGTNLTNYFVVDSLCCPSRTAIFTGAYPHDNGVFTNTGSDGGYRAYNAHGNPARSFAVALQQGGYRTGFLGKYLNGYRPGDPVPPGWDQWHAVGDGYAEFNYRMRDNNAVHRYGRRPADYLTDVLAQKATSFVDDSVRTGKPFLMEVSTFAPHQPATPAPRYAGRFRTLKAPRTASFNKEVSGATRWLTTVPALGPKEVAGLDATYRQRARSVLAVDDLVGRLQDELRRQGVADNTYLVFSSDNGYHLGEHRLRAGKQTAFDTDITVPLLVTGPGVPHGRTVTEMTSSIDLCPTFEQIGGAQTGAGVDGVSLLALWHGEHPADWQTSVLIEHHNSDGARTSDPDYQANRHGDPPDYAAVRTRSALYVEYGDGEREYYDVIRDPNELHNLAGSAPRARLRPLQQRLHALRSCHTTDACRRAAR